LDDICGRPELSEPPAARPDAAVWRLMVRRLVARWWHRRNSPTGVEGGFSDVPIYVRGVDQDIDAWIVSRRSSFGIAGGHADLVGSGPVELHSPRREVAEWIRAQDLTPAVYDGEVVEGDPRSLTVYGAPPAGIDPPA